MERITFNTLQIKKRSREQKLRSERSANLLRYGGIGLLIGGMIAPVLGSLLTALSWILGHDRYGHLLHSAGSVFLILTIPLLVISAFCLDAYEKRGGRIDFDGLDGLDE